MTLSGKGGSALIEWPLKTRVLLGNVSILLFAALVALVGYLPAPAYAEPRDPRLLITLLLLLGTPLAFWLAGAVSQPFREGVDILDIALNTAIDGDFSVRLAPPRQPELRRITVFYNALSERLLLGRRALYQNELLLDTVVQSAPMGILLAGPVDRLILVNKAARDMILPGHALLGLSIAELTEKASTPFREALNAGNDALFTLNSGEDTETFHLSQRHFRINTLPHRLILVKRLTRELRRQEVVTWKKLIRLINHELNNTLAPLRSLLHSARTLHSRGPLDPKLLRIFDSMDTTTGHLQRFLEDYASFARLPDPRKRKVLLKPFFESLTDLLPFRLEAETMPLSASFDPDQIHRLLVNLLKNAMESSAEESTVSLVVSPSTRGGLRFEVRDRGPGMSDEAFDKALLPFYSTKKQGTGLGLPLAREIVESHGGSISIQRRVGGGISVICQLPGSEV